MQFQCRYKYVARIGLLLLASLAVGYWLVVKPAPVPVQSETLLSKIQRKGSLDVITRLGPTSYFMIDNIAYGFEYELISGYAKYLGVKLNLKQAVKYSDLVDEVGKAQVDFAAAGITITPERQNRVVFGPSYQSITQQIVYKRGNKKPRSVADLLEGNLAVLAGTSYLETLTQLKKSEPKLTWTELENANIEEIFMSISAGVFDYTIVDSNLISVYKRFNPDILPAFSLDGNYQLAWAFNKGKDTTLIENARNYFDIIEKNGTLDALSYKYYGHLSDYDVVGSYTYLNHVDKRLPKFVPIFVDAANQFRFDWRLLAALAYQESNWNPNAKSPTGVRGIMMLTLPTAKQMGVDNRLDPTQSIHGGAKYLRKLTQSFPKRIQEPDRTWFALAAYNIGFGHLEDARIITQTLGGDADKWGDVKNHLPLLAEEKWAAKSRYGYAKGQIPVRYVENIRSYYDILQWVSTTLPAKSLVADVP